ARWWSLVIAAAFAAVAFLLPNALTPLNRAWTRFGLLLHKIVSPIVLGFLFYIVVTPLGLLMRLLGKDPLRLRWDRQSSTYWIERKPAGPKPETLSDQF
ncbi:MAG: SxtJ family membrane protein, partial [Burkholderiaceae bacterium]|nr:SxtJ family membrane protein [Burkholderiaceae bacterium]